MHLASTVTIGCAIAVALAVAVTWSRFAADVRAHRARVRRGRRVVPTALGPIEVAIHGAGPPVLVSHAFGAGFDRADAQRLVEAGFQVIAPSRFGYLRSPMPSDPSPEKQADAFAALLDELGIERVAIVGISAGAIAALHFAARHPARCRSLTVIVPPLCTEPPLPRSECFVFSDFAYWLALKVARSVMIRCLLGAEPFVVDAAPPDERRRARDVLANLLPIRERVRGILDDRCTMTTPQSIAFDRIEAPTLVMSTKDDLHGTHDAARLIATRIPGARLVVYRTGGHTWIGHDRELFSEVLGALA
jgi:pimeloyl-ACP methyl ester carboxylesterase